MWPLCQRAVVLASVTLAANIALSPVRPAPSGRVRQAWAVALTSGYLQDVGPSGVLLYAPARGELGLAIRRLRDGSVERQVVISGQQRFIAAHPGGYRIDVRFLKLRWLSARYVVASTYYPWLALIDLDTDALVRWVMPAPDLFEKNVPLDMIEQPQGALSPPAGPPRGLAASGPSSARAIETSAPLRRDPRRAASVAWSFDTPWTMLAVSPNHGRIAAAYNTGSSPRVFIYSADLTKKLQTWALPQYIRSICWSPDGQRIAIVYFGNYAREGDTYKMFWGGSSGLPDVSIRDAATGRELVHYYSGSSETQAAFGPDGRVLYTVNARDIAGTRPAIQAFDVFTGRRMRTYRANIPLSNELAVSPDGRFLAADGFSRYWVPPFLENNTWGGHERIVILDAATGRRVYEYRWNSSNELTNRPLFSPDGQLLFAQFDSGTSRREVYGGIQHLIAFSLAGLYSGPAADPVQP